MMIQQLPVNNTLALSTPTAMVKGNSNKSVFPQKQFGYIRRTLSRSASSDACERPSRRSSLTRGGSRKVSRSASSDDLPTKNSIRRRLSLTFSGGNSGDSSNNNNGKRNVKKTVRFRSNAFGKLQVTTHKVPSFLPFKNDMFWSSEDEFARSGHHDWDSPEELQQAKNYVKAFILFQREVFGGGSGTNTSKSLSPSKFKAIQKGRCAGLAGMEQFNQLYQTERIEQTKDIVQNIVRSYRKLRDQYSNDPDTVAQSLSHIAKSLTATHLCWAQLLALADQRAIQENNTKDLEDDFDLNASQATMTTMNESQTTLTVDGSFHGFAESKHHAHKLSEHENQYFDDDVVDDDSSVTSFE